MGIVYSACEPQREIRANPTNCQQRENGAGLISIALQWRRARP